MTSEPTPIGQLLGALAELQATIVAGLAVPDPPDSDPLIALIRESQLLVLSYPAAAAGVVKSLAAVGRQHAETAEGKSLVAGLVASDEVERLRAVWEAITLNVLDGASPTRSVPSAWIELIVDGVSAQHISESAEAIRPEGFAG